MGNCITPSAGKPGADNRDQNSQNGNITCNNIETKRSKSSNKKKGKKSSKSKADKNEGVTRNPKMSDKSIAVKRDNTKYDCSIF